MSAKSWSSLNLGTGGGDDESAAQTNQRLLAAVLKVDTLVAMRQVHGADVCVVGDRPPIEPPEADALVTDCRNLGLLVRVADCLPVVLADPHVGVVAVAHAGRGGMVAGVVPRTLSSMRQLGARDIRAWFGPRVCGDCYEVPASLADEVCAEIPAARSVTSWGTPALDIAAGVSAQLCEAGVPIEDLGAGRCTIEDEELYSYRRQGKDSGRLGAVVVLR